MNIINVLAGSICTAKPPRTLIYLNLPLGTILVLGMRIEKPPGVVAALGYKV